MGDDAISVQKVIYTKLKIAEKAPCENCGYHAWIGIKLADCTATHTERAVGQTVRFKPGPASSVNIRRLWDTRNLRRTSPSSKHSKKTALPDSRLATSWRSAFTVLFESWYPTKLCQPNKNFVLTHHAITLHKCDIYTYIYIHVYIYY